MCSTNKPNINETAHVNNPVSLESGMDNLILQLDNYRDELSRLMDLNLEQSDLESKKDEGTINSNEEKRLKELKETQEDRKIQYGETFIKVNELFVLLEQLSRTLNIKY